MGRMGRAVWGAGPCGGPGRVRKITPLTHFAQIDARTLRAETSRRLKSFSTNHAKTLFTLKLENSFSMTTPKPKCFDSLPNGFSTPKLWRPSASHKNRSEVNFTPKSKGEKILARGTLKSFVTPKWMFAPKLVIFRLSRRAAQIAIIFELLSSSSL